MKNNVILWLVNCITGTFFSFGLISTIYLLITRFTDTEYNGKMATFLLVTLFIGWVCNFIYHLNSKLPIKAILHSVIWFMLASISYMTIFETDIEIITLIKSMVIFGVVYSFALMCIDKLTKKFNTPFRHFNEFISKLTQFLLK